MKTAAFALALAFLAASVHGATVYCDSADSDPDGDGWGWEKNASCVVHGSIADSVVPTNLTIAANGKPYCVKPAISDPDGDGWGWEYGQSCVAKGSIADPAGTTAPVPGSTTAAPTSPVPTASNGFPFCSSPDKDPDGDGWGWENNKSCIVHGSAADPDGATTAPPPDSGLCVVDTVIYPVCATDTTSWGYENAKICVSKSFCPATRQNAQAAASDALVDAKATASAQAVFKYMKSIWGTKTISGVQDLTWKDSENMYQRVVDDTGKAPALMGYDFMNYLYTYTIDGQTQVEKALAHWKNGGLVAFCWHWRVGKSLEFYSEKTSTQIPIKDYQLDTTSADFKEIVADLDIVAKQLKRLQDAGVAVLWRPLHEASGGWFWWGRTRTDGVPAAYAYTLLYRYIYDYFTTTYGLHNLIWVWNGQKQSWYPGDKYVDIAGTDVYDGQKNYISEVSAYTTLKAWPPQLKPVAMTENSNIPDPDAMAKDGAWWLWFMVWNDGTAGIGVNDSNNFWTGEYYNTNEHKKAVMTHANVITLDKLPKFDGSTTAPTTAPATTAPATTAPATTKPVTTAPATTKPVTTAPVTTAPATTEPATTAPVTSAPGTVKHWGQCGGINYSGPTQCEAGTTCTKLNDWYFQCL